MWTRPQRVNQTGVPSVERFLDAVRLGGSEGRGMRLATVDPAYTSGDPQVTFDGELTLSAKGYPYLSSYAPAAGDRVLLVPSGITYVIVGTLDGDGPIFESTPPDVQVFTANGTWNKPAGAVKVRVQVQAGGGAGAGAVATAANTSCGAGGQGGAYAESWFDAGSLGSSETVTRGIGGVPHATGGQGGAGGTSSFGAHVSAQGGGGGSGAAAGTSIAAVGGASVAQTMVGTVQIGGGGGIGCIRLSATGAISGAGGNSFLGTGGGSSGQPSAPAVQSGRGYGGGGGGATNGQTAAGNPGGAGAAGVIIVTTYF